MLETLAAERWPRSGVLVRLVGFYARRILAAQVRAMGAVAAVTIGSALLEGARAETVGIALSALSVMYLFALPMVAMRDRLDGSLKITAGLPIDPKKIGVARLVAGWLATLPAALQAAVAEGLYGPLLTPLPRSVGSVVLVFVCVWLVSATISVLMASTLTRWDADRLIMWPFVVWIVGLMALDRILETVDPVVMERIVDWLLGLNVVMPGSMMIVVVFAALQRLSIAWVAIGLERIEPRAG